MNRNKENPILWSEIKSPEAHVHKDVMASLCRIKDHLLTLFSAHEVAKDGGNSHGAREVCHSYIPVGSSSLTSRDVCVYTVVHTSNMPVL